MGNCLGVFEYELLGSQSNWMRVLCLHKCPFQPTLANIGRFKISHKHDCNKRCRNSSQEIVAGPVTVLDEATDDVKLHYDLGQVLGRGQCGVIRLCTKKRTGEKFACKCIAKARLCTKKDVDGVRREINIMRKLRGHPNIVELKHVYEDEEWVHLVMELCEGGELFDCIAQKKVFSEKEAATICKTLMEALIYCHDQGVIHRDLKPENILLANKSKIELSIVKIADFGLAVNFQPGEKVFGKAGSAYYIAPEVLKSEYGKEIDVWSAGIVLYILLSGVPPFWGDTVDETFDAIKFGLLDLITHPWPTISTSAKDLIKGMLRQEIKKRLTPEQILNHRWIVESTSNTD